GGVIGGGVGNLRGPATRPIGAVTAADKNTGKTLLTKVIGIVGTGREIPAQSLSIAPEEVEKRILPILREGRTYALFDNVSERLESDTLDAMLTAPFWSGRVLGESTVLELPNTTQWMATGNRMRMEGQMARRSITIALRKQPAGHVFKYKSLETWTRVHRPQLVHAVLTLVQHWIVNRKRRPFIDRKLDSFEMFSEVIGGILQAA